MTSQKDNTISRSLMSILAEKAGPNSINFGIGEPTYPTPRALKETMMSFIKEDSADYGPVAGLKSFRDFLAGRYSSRATKFTVSSDNVLTTCGVTEAIYISLAALLKDGGEIIYPNPGFVLYEQAIKMCGGVAVPFKLDRENGFSANPQLLEKQITNNTKAVIINSPSNPSGTITPRQTLKELAGVCDKKGVPIISDEIYEHHIYEGRHHSIAEFSDNVIICSGISKLFRLAGWRLGWCVAKDELLDKLIKYHQYAVFRAPTISQKVAQAALSMKDQIGEMVDHSKQKRDLMLGLLQNINGINVINPEATFFLYADFSSYGDDWDLALKFLQAGVITVPSTGPGAGFGSNGKGFMRLSYALDNENDLRQGINKIEEVLRSVRHKH